MTGIRSKSKPATVIRAAMRALGREEAVIDEVMRRKMRASLADARDDMPAEDVFARIRAYHADQLKIT